MKLFLRFFFLLLLFLHGAFGLRAQYATDTAGLAFKTKMIVVPVSLMASGLIVQGSISRQLQNRIIFRYPGFQNSADDYLDFLPGAVSLGLGAAGVKGKHQFGEQVILTVLSAIAAQGVTQSFKMLAKYPRPDNIGYDAFPSGHTTMAFTSATLLHQEYGHRSVWYSVGGYGTAVSVGTLRMLNNRHWLSDVLFGAGVGIGATKAVYYMYPRIKRKITKRRQR